MKERDASVVGAPIPGLVGIDARTSEQDWVVTGVHAGQSFKRYVSPNVDADGAMMHVVSALRLNPQRIEWISARRRHEVERCVRMDPDWLRSRTR